MAYAQQLALPTFALVWLVVTGLINLWDPGYIFNRPESMAGGKYETIWRAQQIYASVDLRYADLHDPWVKLVAYFNIVEALLGFYAVFQHFTGSKSKAIITAFSVSLMTLFKTTMYYVIEYIEDFKYIKDAMENNQKDFWLLYNLPNFFWFLFPILTMVAGYNRMMIAFNEKQKKQ